MDSRTLAFVLAISWPAAAAFAWDATRHESVCGIAIEKLPAFVGASDAVVERPCARLRQGVGMAGKGGGRADSRCPLIAGRGCPI